MRENGKLLHLRAELQTPETGEPPQLFFRPTTLFSAMHLQFFGYIAHSAQLRQCKRPGCPEWVTYGPGTGRRETGEYCSKRCANQHRYQRQKGGTEIMRGNITQRGENSWRLKFDAGCDETGNRKTQYVTFRGTKREARAKLNELLAAVGAGVVR